MVNNRRILFATVTSVVMLITGVAPAFGAFQASDPRPLRQGPLVRLHSIASTLNTKDVPAVVVGWREGSNPGRLFMTFSIDGGESYLRSNGKLRKFAVAGDGNKGLSLDICADNIWAGSAAHAPGDGRAKDTDVLITRRVIGAKASQVFVTSPSIARKVRDVSVACVGRKLLAIAWLEQSGGKSKARLMLRDLESLAPAATGVAPAATKKVFGLGEARFGDRISVAATDKAVHVAWVQGSERNLIYRNFLIGDEPDPVITKGPTLVLAEKDVRAPELAAHGQKVVLAYTDHGKVKIRTSTDLGTEFAPATNVIATGTVKKPSKAHSIDVFGNRVVLDATRVQTGTSKAQRHQSTDLGLTWTEASYGHRGPRVGALLKTGGGTSVLNEAWLNNSTRQDTMRAHVEKP